MQVDIWTACWSGTTELYDCLVVRIQPQVSFVLYWRHSIHCWQHKTETIVSGPGPSEITRFPFQTETGVFIAGWRFQELKNQKDWMGCRMATDSTLTACCCLNVNFGWTLSLPFSMKSGTIEAFSVFGRCCKSFIKTIRSVFLCIHVIWKGLQDFCSTFPGVNEMGRFGKIQQWLCFMKLIL